MKVTMIVTIARWPNVAMKMGNAKIMGRKERLS